MFEKTTSWLKDNIDIILISPDSPETITTTTTTKSDFFCFRSKLLLLEFSLCIKNISSSNLWQLYFLINFDDDDDDSMNVYVWIRSSILLLLLPPLLSTKTTL
ncbi:hypothetical protein DERP_004333 [Dermatophagoides pteronyssinus]|uniref:Uncharacterized protein n=1 Tax=Dermatophagoides pteronyssinus TaxID=6956 RepID=A0ABQ8JPC4_DERPT|nr:hypothetical protein DERP_004333 [Dermatophagoides pteronyssinus]